MNTSCQDRKESAEGFVHHWMTSLSTITAFLSHVYDAVLVNCHQKKNTGIFSGVAILHAPAAVLSSLVLVSRQNVGKPGEDTKRFGFANIFT